MKGETRREVGNRGSVVFFKKVLKPTEKKKGAPKNQRVFEIR